MKLTFVRATPADVDVLIAVQNDAFAEDKARYDDCPSYAEPPERMAEMVREALVYRIEADGRTVGDIIARRRDAGVYYLRTLAVVPEMQGKGIGSAAIAFLEAEFPDATLWQLETPEGTPRNCRFYEMLGYRSVGRIERSPVLTLVEYEKAIERA